MLPQILEQKLSAIFLILGQRKETAHSRSKLILGPTLTGSGVADSYRVLLCVWVSSARRGCGHISSILLVQAGVLGGYSEKGQRYKGIQN